MQENPSVVSINKRSSLDAPLSGAEMLMTKLSSRNLYELQVKSASYDVMMQRFQLRKMSENNVAGGKFKHAVIDTVLRKKGADLKTPKLSPRYLLRLLTRTKTWLQVWRVITSPLSPGGWMSTSHGLFMFATNQFQLFYLPFAWIYYPTGSVYTFHAGMGLQFVYLLDLGLNLNTSFMCQHELVVSRWEIALNYISKWFALELISAVPINAIIVHVATQPSGTVLKALLQYDAVLMVLRILRLLLVEQSLLPTRLLQESKQLVSWFTYSRYAHLLGIVKLIWLVLVVAHYMGCFWHVIAQHRTMTYVGEQYVADFYYAVQLIQGQGTMTGTWGENLYSTFVILIGSGILAIVFGNVAMLVSNFNANTTKYQQKMEGVFATMDKMGLPLKLRERVHQYYTHVWTEYESLDGDIVNFQRELAHTLGLEVGLYKYMNLVVKIPFWESCSPDFATQIIRNLAVRVYLPDDYVVRKGETGAEMFILNRGICELSDPSKNQQPKLAFISTPSTKEGVSQHSELPETIVDSSSDSASESSENGTIFVGKGHFDPLTRKSEKLKRSPKPTLRRSSIVGDKRRQILPSNYEISADDNSLGKTDANTQILLYPGQAFGEMSLLMNYKRTANIRAATYVEICCLDRSNFQRIISRYPDDRRHVLTMMLKSCIEKKEIPFPWDEVVDAVAERRRQNGEVGPSRLHMHSTVTSTEAAQALVDRIDINRPDESIKYGFQTFHPDLINQPATSMLDNKSPYLRHHSSGRKVSRTHVEKIRAVQSKTQPVADPHIEGLEQMLGTLMTVVTSMAASIERLEKNAAKSSTACCACCPAGSSPLHQCDTPTIVLSQKVKPDFARASHVKQGGEVRRAEGKSLRPSRPKILRRNSTSDVVPGAYQNASDNSTIDREPLRPRSKSKISDNVVYLDKVFRSVQVPVVLESLPSNDQPEDGLRDLPDSQSTRDSDLYNIPKHGHGWLSRGASQSSEPTFADQLWSRHSNTTRKIGEHGKSATDPRQLRSRASIPANFERLAPVPQVSLADQSTRALQGPHLERFRAK